jgi:serine/threonine protein kinase/osmotically-inducible protein OsmY
MDHPERLGKYVVTDVLGKGAMGIVYKAHDPDIQRTVAIKTIRRELVEDDERAGTVMARFKNEARAAGRLSHPGIVGVFDYGEVADVAFIAMEFVEGNSLRAYFNRETRFEERDVVSLMAQLLDALQHAHEQGVWHRDVKPANVIIMNSGKLKIADFGIARIDSSSLTQVGAVMGSPGYMAPEQYKGDAVDWRADIFAAGVMLYQLLTGTRPFTGSAEQLAYKVCYVSPPLPSEVSPGHDLERYDAVVSRALSKVPQERYASAAEFKAAILEAYAEPVSPTISEETIINEPARAAGILDPSHPSWQTDRSSSSGSSPGPRSIGTDPTPIPRTIPPRSSAPGTRPPERAETIGPTGAASQWTGGGSPLAAPRSHVGIAWAVAGIAVAIAVGVVAWHSGRSARITADVSPAVEPVATPTTVLPARPAPPAVTSGARDDAEQASRKAAEAERIAAAQARAEREAAEARQRAAAEAQARTEAKARADREAAAARARAEREAAARRAAEEKAHADAERARAVALQNRSGTAAQQAATAPQTEAERLRDAQLAAEARARAEAERARTTVAAAPPTATAPPASAEPAREPSFFRDEGINLKVASKLQFNRELLKEQITTKVSAGVVTLTGTVSTQAKRELAEKVAGEVSGVVRVNNNLKVAGQ